MKVSVGRTSMEGLKEERCVDLQLGLFIDLIHVVTVPLVLVFTHKAQSTKHHKQYHISDY